MPRKPTVAGRFYPADPDALRSMIEKFTPGAEQKESALGALCPHAGYVFCGGTAGKLFARLDVPSTVVVLNPSHNFYSPPFALWDDGPWQTPLGTVPLHGDLCGALAELRPMELDRRAHMPEHAGEVVLPWLQYHQPELKIAVICVTTGAEVEDIQVVGRGIADALKKCGEERALVVASSDMSHEQGPDALEVVNRNDPLAIERMEKLDPEGLVRVCERQNVTMCGALPAAIMMCSARARGGSSGELVERSTSADSPQGGGSYVVGYAGMIFR